MTPAIMKAFLSASFLSVSAIAVSSTIPPSLTDGTCANLLVDDFASQSRLTFLFYNAMLQPSSDDGTMASITGRADTATSVIVSNNHLTLTSAEDGTSYWYTMLGCTRATDMYGGIDMTIKAPKGTTMTIELQTSKICSSGNPTLHDLDSTALGWVFDGTEQYYSIPFSRFQGLDTDHLLSLLLSGISKPITLGPIAFYCGPSGTEYPVPSGIPILEPTSKIPATIGPSAFVIYTFGNGNSNNLGFYHGGDDAATYKLSKGRMTINMKGN